MDILDYISNYLLMPVVAIGTCVLIGWVRRFEHIRLTAILFGIFRLIFLALQPVRHRQMHRNLLENLWL